MDAGVTMGKRISQLREERGWTLQTLADRAGLSKSHVWNLEQGQARNPTLDAAVRLSKALGVSLDYLTGLVIGRPYLHPEAMRIACEIDTLLNAPKGKHVARR